MESITNPSGFVSNEFRITVIHADIEVGKRIELREDGTLHIIGGVVPGFGDVAVETVSSMAQLYQRVQQFTSRDMAITGQLDGSRMSARLLCDGRLPLGAPEFASRANGHGFAFTPGPAIWWLDSDAHHSPEILTQPQMLLDKIAEAVRYRERGHEAVELIDWSATATLVIPSTSAFVHTLDGVELRGATGWRVGIPVQDAADIPHCLLPELSRFVADGLVTLANHSATKRAAAAGQCHLRTEFEASSLWITAFCRNEDIASPISRCMRTFPRLAPQLGCWPLIHWSRPIGLQKARKIGGTTLGLCDSATPTHKAK